MSLVIQEFETAFTKAQVKYPYVLKSKGRDIIHGVITRIERNKRERYNERFIEIVRLVLNVNSVIFEERSGYASLVGHYFGPRANKVKQRRRTQKTVRKVLSPVRILLREDGQFVLDI